MQRIFIDEPYEFVPPVYSEWGPRIMQFYVPRFLRKTYGVHSVEFRQVERLRESLKAGHSIMLCPNHCRLADPLILGLLARQADCYLFAMASWHLFKQDWWQRFMMRRLGAFSVLREGNDRQALDTAIKMMVERRRPLIVFPEGVVTRHNDLVEEMMDGPSFIARQAAKRLKRDKQPVQVVIHPVAIRYSFLGDLNAALEPELDKFEARFSWQPQRQFTLVERIGKIGEALLALKEIEFLGQARTGDPYERAELFVEQVLGKLEKHWKLNDTSGGVVARVKQLRSKIMAELIEGGLSKAERDRRWRHLAASYYVQQISHYPRDYILREKNIPERVVETVERFEEDFTDQSKVFEPFHAVLEVGEAIPVGPHRDRSTKGDPIMENVRVQLQAMIDALAAEREAV